MITNARHARIPGLVEPGLPPFFFTSASGGTESTWTDTLVTGYTYKIHRFLSSGSLSVLKEGPIDYLIVAGGGSGLGGSSINLSGGGGGGGGVIYRVNIQLSFGAYSAAVGGANANSSFVGVTATKGGYGGHGGVGQAGGSGGGGGANFYAGGVGTSQQGNSGGAARRYAGGGGGGAGGAGATAPDDRTGGNGGPGFVCSITGTSVAYGVGGRGANDAVWNGVAGGANTGNGGGGGGSQVAGGAPGGSGIVIVRYRIS